MQIFVHSHGQKHAPLTLEEVNRRLQAGQFLPDDLAWHEGLPTWIPLRTVQGVIVPLTPAASLPVPPGPLTPVAPQVPSRTDPLAICSLVFGILGVVCCSFLLPSIAAVVCGHISLLNFKKDPFLQGRGLAIAGLITGYIGLTVGLTYLIFTIVAVFVPTVLENVK